MSQDSPSPLAQNPTSRLASLDVFRGFIMFWIIGGESIAHALTNLKGLDSPILDTIAIQLEHAAWEGFHFYDLIFPSFVFIVGTSIVYSLGKIMASGDRSAAARRVIRRGLLLWLIGIIYYGGISKGFYNAELDQGVRLLGVLQRIGICYLVTGLLFLYLPVRGLVISFVTLLVGYWLLLAFVPVPGQGAVSFEEGKNLTNWFDSRFLPFFKWNGSHDPEGILSTLPAIATCLLGVFAGLLLRNGSTSGGKKFLILLVAGIASIALGHIWGMSFPVIKNLWTSSFVLLAGGWSLVLLATFYCLVDLCGLKKMAMPFVWIGMNPFVIYLLYRVIDFNEVSSFMLGGPVSEWADSLTPGLGGLLVALGEVILILWICKFLYRKDVFVRI